ncbi:ABC transporter ATP-binding protein [Corynebacterium sp. S7]
MSNKTTVVVRNLNKSFFIDRNGSEKSVWNRKNRKEVKALNGINFVAYAGESIGVIGRNGSGKSTLLNIIAGNERPSSGELLVSSRPTILGVSAALQGHLDGRANVRLGLLAMGISPNQAEEMVPSVLEWAELTEAADRPMSTYSSGMKSRLKFAIATAVRREILLVDEALATGDSSFTSKAADRMESFLTEAGTVFIVSHSTGTIEKNCNRAIWMHDGELIADGNPTFVTKLYRAWSRNMSNGDTDIADGIITKRKEVFDTSEIVFESEAVDALG